MKRNAREKSKAVLAKIQTGIRKYGTAELYYIQLLPMPKHYCITLPFSINSFGFLSGMFSQLRGEFHT